MRTLNFKGIALILYSILLSITNLLLKSSVLLIVSGIMGTIGLGMALFYATDGSDSENVDKDSKKHK